MLVELAVVRGFQETFPPVPRLALHNDQAKPAETGVLSHQNLYLSATKSTLFDHGMTCATPLTNSGKYHILIRNIIDE